MGFGKPHIIQIVPETFSNVVFKFPGQMFLGKVGVGCHIAQSKRFLAMILYIGHDFSVTFLIFPAYFFDRFRMRDKKIGQQAVGYMHQKTVDLQIKEAAFGGLQIKLMHPLHRLRDFLPNILMICKVSMAYTSLPSYCTDDPVDRSQMCVYTMLVAAAMQTILASTIMPMVNFFGGQNSQMAWVKSISAFGVLGIIFLYLNVLFVKERVDNNAPPENILVGVKCAFKNKYWIYSLLANICNNAVLVFNLSVSVYYLGNVTGNLGLMGAFVGCSNIPGVIMMMFTPAMLTRVSKRKLAVFGSILMLGGQIAFILGPSGSTAWLLGTALIRGIGFGFTMGLNGAMVADCIDYGEWKTGTRVQSVLFSSNSVGVKVGSGLLTSGLGFFLTAVGYDGLKQVQDVATITGIDNFFKFVPILIFVLLLIFSYLFDLEEKLPEIQKELIERRGPIEHIG